MGIVRQFALPLVVWLHACIGLHFAWRLRPWYRDLAAGALRRRPAGPGRPASSAPRSPCATSPNWPSSRASSRTCSTACMRPTPADIANALYASRDTCRSAALAAAGRRSARAAAARLLGATRRRRASRLRRTPAASTQPTGLTILEMSRIAGIPHASVCGGRGRCSTCRVRIGGADRAKLPPPSPEEQKVLARVGAPANVRLACQLQPAARPLSRHAAAAGRRPARSRPIAASRRRMAASTTSRSCSPTSAASPRSPRASCPTTWCSCSTAISAPPARPSRRPAAGSTSSSATA